MRNPGCEYALPSEVLECPPEDPTRQSEILRWYSVVSFWKGTGRNFSHKQIASEDNTQVSSRRGILSPTSLRWREGIRISLRPLNHLNDLSVRMSSSPCTFYFARPLSLLSVTHKDHNSKIPPHWPSQYLSPFRKMISTKYCGRTLQNHTDSWGEGMLAPF